MDIRTTLLTGVALALAACGSDPGQVGSDSTKTTSAALEGADVSTQTVGGSRGTGAVIPALPSKPTVTTSTVPPNGDVNPYGIAFVPAGFPSGGLLSPGEIIVENFNNQMNNQGTGTTIVRVNKNASPTVFFKGAPFPGFSTALGILQRGFILQGYVPSTDGSGMCNGQQSNVGQGAILVIDRRGRLVGVLTNPRLLDGPWDLALEDYGDYATLFVSNVKTGTVTRLDLRVEAEADGGGGVVVERETQIASGYAHRCDPAAFVVGPTGLAIDHARDLLYVASTADNAIYVVPNASSTIVDHGTGLALVKDPTHLHGPVGLLRAPNGDLLSAQGDAVNADPKHPSEIVEFTSSGQFVAEISVDSAPGSAFGLALEEQVVGFGSFGFTFAAVDDGQNVLQVWVVK
jgi:hypothetical protein